MCKFVHVNAMLEVIIAICFYARTVLCHDRLDYLDTNQGHYRIRDGDIDIFLGEIRL